ncbi:MAG TPA: hypothetical protein VGB56_00595 [Flavisolibacter sp.]
MSAGTEYRAGFVQELLLGRNWRREWETPVQVAQVSLDTLRGGLWPYAKSGGGESRSLRLRSKSGKEYALRSINKSRISVLPPLLQFTPYGALVQDGVSMSHPFAAFALHPMMAAAGIPHTRPVLVYVPKQTALDTFNALYGNDLYLLEEKAEGDWSSAAHLGSFRRFMDTESVKDSLRKNNRIKADQHAFIKARLFDILISDVDRHAGNWNWGVQESGKVIFTPIPGDRDQAFFTHNGLLSKLTLALTRRRWMQSFRNKISNVATLTSYDQKLDKFFANEMASVHWQAAASHLQIELTDSIIEASVRQLPQEVFAVSGPEVIRKLKIRRTDLRAYAEKYYRFLAKSVDINGSEGKEWFEVSRGQGKEIVVAVYSANGIGVRESTPYYQRLFHPGETKRIRLYGAGGDDVFKGLEGDASISIKFSPASNKSHYAIKSN